MNTNDFCDLNAVCARWNYPAGSEEALRDALQRALSCSETAAILRGFKQAYSEHKGFDASAALKALSEAAPLSGVHQYTLHLLFFMGLLEEAQRRYRRAGFSEELFQNTFADLRYKLAECLQVHGIYGSFVAWWFSDFFDLKRFALGRLQFEITGFKGTEKYSRGGITLCQGVPVVNVHIPSSGPLIHEDCLSAYGMAADFFSPIFSAGTLPFVCYSWLLSSVNASLGEDSHIRHFAADYELLFESDDENWGDAWRIFGCSAEGDPARLPDDTRLRRLYKQRRLEGLPMTMGYGLFLRQG